MNSDKESALRVAESSQSESETAPIDPPPDGGFGWLQVFVGQYVKKPTLAAPSLPLRLPIVMTKLTNPPQVSPCSIPSDGLTAMVSFRTITQRNYTYLYQLSHGPGVCKYSC